jgi:hypothetical protein
VTDLRPIVTTAAETWYRLRVSKRVAYASLSPTHACVQPVQDRRLHFLAIPKTEPLTGGDTAIAVTSRHTISCQQLPQAATGSGRVRIHSIHRQQRVGSADFTAR